MDRTVIPDFSGVWVPTRGRGEALPAGFDASTGNFNHVLRSRTNNPVDFERDAGIRQRIFPREGRPWYKPQYWDRVQFNDVHGHSLLAPDPAFQCMPEGVPRMGLPQEIVHTDKQMIFLYPLHIRRIYLDGRPQPPEEQWIGTWFGHSVGRWEETRWSSTTVDFNGLEWLGWPGWFTSPDKRVTERMRRVGNTLTWQATVEDSVLLRPWRPAMQTTTAEHRIPRRKSRSPALCREGPGAHGHQGAGLTKGFPEGGAMRTHAIASLVAAAVAFAGAVPQAQDTNLKEVLRKIGLGLGILRGVQEEDSLMTVEYWGTGTMRDVGPKTVGPPVQIKSYYAAVAYDFPGMRVDHDTRRRDSAAARNPGREWHIRVERDRQDRGRTSRDGGAPFPSWTP